MKIAVLILSTTKEPSTSNVQSMRESFIAYCEENKDSLQNEYQFFEYFGVPNNSESEVKHLAIKLGNDTANMQPIVVIIVAIIIV